MKKTILFLIIALPIGSLFAQSNTTGSRLTTVYKPDTLQRFGAYTNVAYLLKKTKGFEIGDDGTVFHDGYQVNRAKINGKDYVGVNIAKTIRRLPADGVINITMVDDGSAEKMGDGRPGNPQEILNIIFSDNRPPYPSDFPGDGQFRSRGRRITNTGYADPYTDPLQLDLRNPLDRSTERAIRNMQSSINSMYEVDEWGDHIPHFIIKEWPGPGKPKVKKDKMVADAAQGDKQVQPK